jgi:Enoyl-CoA hydratase/carnithine racemase
MSFKNVNFEKDGKMVVITINRPKALNALNSETLVEIDSAIDMVAEDEDVLAVILTGAGKSFVAGADISEMKGLNAIEGRKFGILGNKVF